MKSLSLALLVSIFFLASCKKGDVGPAGEQGEQGEQGPQGSQGPQGIAGNANAMQYTFGVQNLVSSFVTMQVTTTIDTMNNSTWLVYLYYQPLLRWYFIPGQGFGGSTTYRVSMAYASNKVNIYIDKTGPGESYAAAKVVRIYNSGSIAGRSIAEAGSLAKLDYNDYEVVREYYNLPD